MSSGRSRPGLPLSLFPRGPLGYHPIHNGGLPDPSLGRTATTLITTFLESVREVCASTLISLCKKDGGVRPIAVGGHPQASGGQLSPPLAIRYSGVGYPTTKAVRGGCAMLSKHGVYEAATVYVGMRPRLVSFLFPKSVVCSPGAAVVPNDNPSGRFQVNSQVWVSAQRFLRMFLGNSFWRLFLGAPGGGSRQARWVARPSVFRRSLSPPLPPQNNEAFCHLAVCVLEMSAACQTVEMERLPLWLNKGKPKLYKLQPKCRSPFPSPSFSNELLKALGEAQSCPCFASQSSRTPLTGKLWHSLNGSNQQNGSELRGRILQVVLSKLF